MALACVTLIIALAACRSPLSSDSESSVSPDPRPTRLAVRAVPLEEVRPGGTPKNPPGGTSRGGLPSPEGATVRTFRTVAAFTDPPGDAGVQAPAHADVRKATIDDDRESARVTVEVGGDLPNPLSDGEVQGVGVDFFLGENIESDYQLFADGGVDGWFAYLHAPSGLVQYPGTMQIGGSLIVFVVPWSSIGDLRRASVSAFCDWSKRGALPINTSSSSSDRAPDSGRASITR